MFVLLNIGAQTFPICTPVSPIFLQIITIFPLSLLWEDLVVDWEDLVVDWEDLVVDWWWIGVELVAMWVVKDGAFLGCAQRMFS